MQPIKLSSKTLVHISSGLYRSTANALKELISNSFDADATLVEINTNYPRFDGLTCKDNGSGMTREEFERLMKGGIGNSMKRTKGTQEKTLSGRPVIGRIGIGLLAIAQVCYEFRVVSHHRATKTAFEAAVNLRPYRRDEIAAEAITPDGDYEIGQFKCDEVEYDQKLDGVFISTKDLLATYTDRYVNDVQREDFKKVPLQFARFMKEVQSRRSIRELGNYWQLFWELCLSCPVPYAEEGPLRTETIIASASHDPKPETKEAAESAAVVSKKLSTALTKYNFTAKIDGTQIRKPVVLPTKQSETAELRAFKLAFEGELEGAKLKYSGFVYLQTKMIKPAEMRGVLIRVRNVAIGDYDLACLNYEKVQGFRRDWVNGEIYVEEGLEDALNIDRHSFNEVHPHYLYLQKHLHRILTENVFPAALRASTESARKRAKAALGGEDSSFLKAIGSVLGAKYTITRPRKKPKEGVPVSINHNKKLVTIYDHNGWPKNRIARSIAERLVVSYMLTRKLAEDPDSIDETVFRIMAESGSK